MSATCSICHENECDMITDCNHSFHRRCLNRWTERRQTCPVCRHELYNEESEDDSEIGVDFSLESDTELDENTTTIFNNTIIDEFRNFDNNMTNILNNFTTRYNNLRNLNTNYTNEILEISEENNNLRNENLLLQDEITSLRRQIRDSDRRNREINTINLRRRILCLEHSNKCN